MAFENKYFFFIGFCKKGEEIWKQRAAGDGGERAEEEEELEVADLN